MQKQKSITLKTRNGALQPVNNALKDIVLELNEFIKLYKILEKQKENITIDDFLQFSQCKKSAELCEGFFLSFDKNSAPIQNDCACYFIKKNFSQLFSSIYSKSILKKLALHWPLQKGSVETKRLAWETTYSAYESAQSTFSFLIKCIFVLKTRVTENKDDTAQLSQLKNLRSKKKHKNILDQFNSLFLTKNIFFNPDILCLFWSDLKNSDFNLNQHVLQGKIVVLCLEETCFCLRSGINTELSLFERFIYHLSQHDNSLIVFSTQKLISEPIKTSILKESYSINLKQDMNPQNYTIEQVMEPDPILRNDDRFSEANRTGCYDRLIELLARGQSFIDTIEKDFLQWKIRTGS